MFRILGIVVLALAWASVAAAQQEVAPDEPPVTPALVQFRLERAAASIDQMRFTAAMMDLDDALKGLAAEPLQEDWARYLRGRALSGMGRGNDGEAEVRAHFSRRPTPYNFKSVFTILALRKKWAAAAGSVIELPDSLFANVNGAPVNAMSRVLLGLREAGQTELHDRLLERLVTAGYTGPFGGKTDDAIRLDYIHRLLTTARTADAAAQTKFIETPSVMVELLTGRTYEALWETPELKALTAKDMQARVRARAQALTARGVKHGGEVLEAMRAYRAAGEPARALDTADKGIAAIATKPNARRFSRLILIEKAYALADLGRSSAAENAFDQLLRDFPEDPVAIRLAYARVLEAAGNGVKAMSVLEPLDPDGLSSPARAISLQISVCAQSGAPDNPMARDARLELEDMGLDAAPSLLDALLCAKDDEAARKLVLGWLLRSDIRDGAIAALQLYAEPKGMGAALSDRRRRLQALIAREDIQAALKPHGRTLGWAFQRATALSY
jgi:tetratricopeptide (TPR) repeat protein